jgi:hypothetical protein
MTRSVSLSASVAAALALLTPTGALAQGAPAPAPAPAGVVTPSPTPGSTYVPAPSQGYGYGPNPSSPNGTIGGGNATESSAHPVTGEEEDSFDFGKGSAGGSVHGDDNGPIFVGGRGGGHLGVSGGEPPPSYLVRRGDTLWGICDTYFENPYQWPRIWAYNPQIKNPHWIYPGDEVRLRTPGDGATGGGPLATAGVPLPPSQQTLVDRRRQVPPGTIFLRDQGWIRDESDEVWGDVTGANADKMFLTDGDEIYLHIDKGHEVHLGEELALFKPLKSSAAGTIVQINGTARIDQWNAQDRVARARVVESLGVVERGARVGPLARRFTIVPPLRNEADVQAHVLASVYPDVFWGQNQVIFIDKGDAAGLKPGNRLQIMRRGDAWRRTLVTPSAGWRVSPDDERPMPPMENTPGSHKDEQNYPDEVVGELRVITTKKDSSVCLVTGSKQEIEPYDLAVAHKGY